MIIVIDQMKNVMILVMWKWLRTVWWVLYNYVMALPFFFTMKEVSDENLLFAK
jgi:riboflavin transporter FmnP